jgi:autotransporter-associated beta strand protein
VGSATGPALAWVNGADAIFPAGTGTVTISGQLTANSLTFQGSGAVLQGATASDSLALLGCGNVTVGSGSTAAINIALVGSGGLSTQGAGTLALGAANTFTGATDVYHGTLQLGDSAGSGSIESSTAINNYATLILPAGATFNLRNTLNNYGTFQSQGAIRCYGEVATWGTLVNASGGSIFVASGGYFFSLGEVDNSGSIESAGGVYDFGAFNSANGTVTVDAGGAFSVRTSAVLSGAIADNGAIYFTDGQQNMTYTGAISGAGCVYVSCGGSTITLSGNSSNFAGLFFVSSGTLQMGANAPDSLGSGSAFLDVCFTGVVDLNGNNLTVGELTSDQQGGTVTDTSSTPGTSTLTLLVAASNGNSTTVAITDGPYRHVALVLGQLGSTGTFAEYLLSTNTYTGGTTIGPDTMLWLGYGGNTGTILGNVLDNGQLLFAPATTIVFSGVISGSGEVDVDAYWGNGMVVLAGVNTVSGGTAVYAGTLDVTGSLTGGPLTVYGGTLSGDGTLGDVSVQGGSFTPGDGGTGTLITGNLTLNSGTQYVVAINGGTAGTGYTQTQANGQVWLGGATLVLTGGGGGSGAIVLIQSTCGISGTFAGLPEGATVTYQGQVYQISYDYNPNGGAGDDVALVPA